MRGEIISAATEKIDAAIAALILPAIQILYSLAIISALGSMLLFSKMQYQMLILIALLAFGIAVLYLVVYRFTIIYVRKSGLNVATAKSRLMDSLNILIDLQQELIARRSNFILNRVLTEIDKKNDNLSYIQILSSTPKFFVELLIYLSLSLFIFVTQENLSSIPTMAALGLFVFLRVSPYLQQLYVGFVSVISVWPTWIDITKYIQYVGDDPNFKKLSFQVTKNKDESFSVACISNDRMFLDGVINLRKNTATLIMGKSGSGKSTLIKNLQMHLNNHNICRASSCFQNPIFFNGTLLENIFLETPSNISDLNVKKMLSYASGLGMKDRVSELFIDNKNTIHINGNNLSGGEKYRLGVLRALLTDPELLILDEPLAALDSENAKKLIKFLVASMAGKTLLIVTHKIINGLEDFKVSILNVNE